MLAIHMSAKECAQNCTRNSRKGKHDSAWPFHRSRMRVRDEVGEGVDRHGQCAGADGNMGVPYTHHVNQQRQRQNRTTPAQQTERETHQGA